jgi:hypothetical protein
MVWGLYGESDAQFDQNGKVCLKLQIMDDIIPASVAKQTFGAVLARAARAPVGVQRHGKLVAAVVSPEWLERRPAGDERRAARAAQQQVEMQRLLGHHRMGLALLCQSAARQRLMVAAARREVDRWEAQRLCSADYIERWRAWLALPARELVTMMCSDADGWGPAMRQNSPLTAAWAPPL